MARFNANRMLPDVVNSPPPHCYTTDIRELLWAIRKAVGPGGDSIVPPWFRFGRNDTPRARLVQEYINGLAGQVVQKLDHFWPAVMADLEERAEGTGYDYEEATFLDEQITVKIIELV